MPAQVYLDYQSSKPVDPRVVDAMRPWFTERFGNPSSLHLDGDEATETLEQSRKKVAQFIGANSDEVIFTSGATESNNLAMIGYVSRNRNRGDHIVIAENEHISVHNIAKAIEKQGFKVSKVGVDQYGRVNIEELRKKIVDTTILVSIGWANSEIGNVQPMQEIADVLHGRGIAFHSDAVAAEGLLPIDMRKIPIDLLTLSSNDIYGPKGIGALYIRKNINIAPIMPGSGQERGLRSGSENMPAIVGMAAAADIMTSEMPSEVLRLAHYRDRLIDGVLNRISKSHLNGHPRERLPNNAHFRFDAIEGESLLLLLKEKGIAASTGSACSSRTLEPSHTLISSGLLHEEAHGSLEFTFGRWSSPADVDYVLRVLPGIIESLRSISPQSRRP
ncbi:MAG: cysteine desulfurase [Deltaproteobacteria bacterium]|nr:cysteine desulfurase [Deltaproteobacteria bacterium]